jgi:hypothetical protein
MSAVDFLLNLAALVLWLTWCGVGQVAPTGTAGTLLGNLKPAGARVQRRWIYLATLLGLLVVRALFYRQVGPSFLWHPVWSTGVIHIPFRSDLFLRIFSYSFLSFVWVLFIWYSWLILILAINRPPHDRDGVTRLARRAVGKVGSFPALILLLLPIVLLGLSWMLVGWIAVEANLLPPLQDFKHLFQQSLVVGLGGILSWRWLLGGLYILHLVNNYVYLGRHAFWEFVQITGTRICWPFSWARLGRLDCSPLIGLLTVWLAWALFASGWPWIQSWVDSPLPAWVEYGILPTVYRDLPWDW